MKRRQNNLDEMQEQRMLHIEHNGCWLAFWGLLIAIIVQTVLYSGDPRVMAGEWIVFMALSVYMMVACVRNGLWDRRLKSDWKTNLIASLIAGAAMAAISYGISWFRFHRPAGSLAVAAVTGCAVFVLCFLTLLLTARLTARRKARLEAEPEEDDD